MVSVVAKWFECVVGLIFKSAWCWTSQSEPTESAAQATIRKFLWKNSRIWRMEPKCLTKSDVQLIPDISRTKNDKRVL